MASFPAGHEPVSLRSQSPSRRLLIWVLFFLPSSGFTEFRALFYVSSSLFLRQCSGVVEDGVSFFSPGKSLWRKGANRFPFPAYGGAGRFSSVNVGYVIFFFLRAGIRIHGLSFHLKELWHPS